MGQQAIYDKLNSFGNVAHQINTLDAQPTLNEGIAVLVSGELSIEGGNPMMFSESFVLFKGGAQGYYIHNNFFRLNLSWKLTIGSKKKFTKV